MEKQLIGRVGFEQYKHVFTKAIRAALQESPERSLDEAAFPAYGHPNRLIHSFYWTRLRAVMQAIEGFGPLETALDFGCGSGVLLPFLAQHAKKVIGVDLDLEPSQKIQKYIQFPENISFINSSASGLREIEPRSINLITAMNVFEHMDEPREMIEHLYDLLRPDGYLVVSLPKENKIYSLARKLAGKEFTGDYHETNYREIEKIIAKKGAMVNIIKSFPHNLVFRIFFMQKYAVLI